MKKMLVIFFVFFAIFTITIGYSALNTDLSISGEAFVKINKDIKITDVNYYETDNDGAETYTSKFSFNTVSLFTRLPNQNSSVTYKIDIVNNTSKDYGIFSITGKNPSLKYEFVDYNIKDKLCTNSTCNNGNTDTVYLKISYQDGMFDGQTIDFASLLTINFAEIYKISYRDIENTSSLPKHFIVGDTFSVTLDSSVEKVKVARNGVILVNGLDYTFKNHVLTIENAKEGYLIIQSIKDYPIKLDFDKEIIVPDSSFSYDNVEFETNGNTIYVEMDITNMNSSHVNENILTIGEQIQEWRPNVYNSLNLHFFYPNSSGDIIAAITTSNKHIQYGYKYKNNGANLIKMAFNANGVYINGEMVINKSGYNTVSGNTYIVSDFTGSSLNDILNNLFSKWDNNMNISIGSKEGDVRSTVKYNEIQVYDQLLTEQELIKLTTIEDFTPPSIDESIELLTGTLVSLENVISGSKFNLGEYAVDTTSNTIYGEIDLSTCTGSLEGILSIGQNIDLWAPKSNSTIHMYYPNPNGRLVVALIMQGGNFLQVQYGITGTTLKFAFNNNGLVINGEKIADKNGLSDNISVVHYPYGTFYPNYFSYWTQTNTATFGSEEGTNRSDATYKKILIHDKILSVEEMVIATTS